MKKTILTIVLLIISSTDMIVAQNYYYNTSKTFVENGYSYKCVTEPAWKGVTLFNANDKYTFEKLLYKDGRKVTDQNTLIGRVKLVEDDNWTRQTCFEIVNNAFSSAEKQRVKTNNRVSITLKIDGSTGKVIEVNFWFLTDSPLATIPVSTYRKIELELKSKIWFTPTPAGKELKFVLNGWMHEIE